MPTERRVISFFEAEFLWAAQQYFLKATGMNIAGNARSVVFSDEGDISAAIRFGGSSVVRTVGQAEIASILIFYCMSAKIPLPKGAVKSLRLRKDRIELLVEYASHPDLG